MLRYKITEGSLNIHRGVSVTKEQLSLSAWVNKLVHNLDLENLTVITIKDLVPWAVMLCVW
jgi:hypothetical protein